MILYHPNLNRELGYSNSFVVDSSSLSLAQITVSWNLKLTVQIIIRADAEEQSISSGLEPFNLKVTARRILEDLQRHILPQIWPGEVGVIGHADVDIPEYLDFYPNHAEGIYIIRTSEPTILAEFEEGQGIKPTSYRSRMVLSAEGWAYFLPEAFEELIVLNGRRVS